MERKLSLENKLLQLKSNATCAKRLAAADTFSLHWSTNQWTNAATLEGNTGLTIAGVGRILGLRDSCLPSPPTGATGKLVGRLILLRGGWACPLPVYPWWHRGRSLPPMLLVLLMAQPQVEFVESDGNTVKGHHPSFFECTYRYSWFTSSHSP